MFLPHLLFWSERLWESRPIVVIKFLGFNNVKSRRGSVGSASDSWSVDTYQSWVRAPSKAPVVSLSKKLYSNCLVLVGSRNGFQRDLQKQKNACFTIELKLISINYKLIMSKVEVNQLVELKMTSFIDVTRLTV